MKNKLLFFCFLLVFISGAIGVLFYSTVIHEYSHMRDFRASNLTLNDEKIVINIPLDWRQVFLGVEGVYSFRVKNIDEFEQGKTMDLKTEIKAYAISIILLCIFLAAYCYILFKFWEIAWWEYS